MPKIRRSAGFLATAKRLCSADGGLEPTQDDLRTADGRCYYAAFHKLSEMIADDFAGREGEPDRSGRAWAGQIHNSMSVVIADVQQTLFSSAQPRPRFSNRGSIAEKSVPAPSSSSTKVS